MSNYQQAFYDEAIELLADLEIQLLELEKQPNDIERIGRIFRALHTIKGSGAMFGFDDVSAFTHNLENVFDLVRSDKLGVTPALIGLALKSRDYIQRLLQSSGTNDPDLDSEGAQLLTMIQQFLPDVNSDTESVEKQSENENVAETAQNQLYYIRFAPFDDLFHMGINPQLLIDELADMGELRFKLYTQDIPALDKMDPETCYVKWNLLLCTKQDKLSVLDVFVFVEDISELVVENLGPASDFIDMDNALEQLSSNRVYEKPELLKLFALQKEPKPEKSSGQTVTSTSEQKSSASLRVASERLDSLVDLVGEFVTMQAHFSQLAKNQSDSETVLLAEQMERLTCELRDNVMSLRMQPIGAMFSKFRRLVRDLSTDQGKDVVLNTQGESTELDKSVIEKLNDPIMHIIRNSIDHGIENTSDRKTSGKPEQGYITLAASHSGANVVIQIVDDGKGLNKDAILKKAVEKSLVPKGQELNDHDIYNLIFQPGFSTAQGVTKLSGRGVGMDVVKKTIDSLGGTVEISSVPGKGTKITLVLPLTLAIIEGLLVTIDDDYYIFPLSSVEECVMMDHKAADAIKGRHLINVREEMVPYLNLREFFEIDKGRPDSEQVVIAKGNTGKFGFVVDRVIGSYQTVIKSLGKMYKNVEGVSGATILGDGSVALILDLIKLENMATVNSMEKNKMQTA